MRRSSRDVQRVTQKLKYIFVRNSKMFVQLFSKWRNHNVPHLSQEFSNCIHIFGLINVPQSTELFPFFDFFFKSSHRIRNLESPLQCKTKNTSFWIKRISLKIHYHLHDYKFSNVAVLQLSALFDLVFCPVVIRIDVVPRRCCKDIYDKPRQTWHGKTRRNKETATLRSSGNQC